jgi:hypothetical protein
MFSLNEPSALLSNARLTIATLIQRPSTVTTSNAFDEFAILDNLIDVSNDVDRFEGGESRKFLNIAQLITASTCIYSHRVDALYKLINAFQSSSPDQSDELESIPVLEEEEEEIQPKKIIQEKKKKIKDHNHSFICQDLNKINLNPSKTFFLDRTSLFDLKLFQKYVPIGNKQFWINDNRPMIFDLLFDDELLDDNNNNNDDHQQPERLIDVLNQSSPEKQRITFDNDDIPLPIPAYDDQETSWNNENPIAPEIFIEKKKPIKSRRKKMPNDLDLNIFRQGLTDAQQGLFRFQKFKPLSNKIKLEQTKFFTKNFNRKHFNALIKGSFKYFLSFNKTFSLDCPSSILSIFIYPIIINHYLSIRERYSIKIDQPIRSTSPDVLDQNFFDPLSPTFIDDIQEDMDIRLQTDMEQILDAAILNSHEEQEHNKIFLELRSSIQTYMTEHESIKQTNLDDLLEILDNQYSLPLVFSQLLHLCASTQRYSLHSTSNDKLFIEKMI